MTDQAPKLVKFQCTAIDFHLGDGRVLYGPKTIGKDEDGDDIDTEGDIAEIPEELAAYGVKKKLGRIVK